MSGGGGGIIIIKQALKQTLGDPLVSGTIPEPLHSEVVALCSMDCGDWTPQQYHTALHAFLYAATHG